MNKFTSRFNNLQIISFLILLNFISAVNGFKHFRLKSPMSNNRIFNNLNKESDENIIFPQITLPDKFVPESLMLLPILFLTPEIVNAVDTNVFDPSQFQPVCPASDGLYQILKGTANSLVGKENVLEYGPLIASVLLRIRLELCVLESFLYEAVIPFINTKGLSWVLPLHETVETFIAGTIFAIASNFILLGSTKIISVLFIYADILTGMPTRTLANILNKFAPKSSLPDVVGSIFKIYGEIIGTLRKFVESTDTFVGRYLVLVTTAYIAFKFAHFKLFNDIFP